MSTKILKHIDMELTPASIDRAIREVRQLQKDLRSMCEDLGRILTREGAKIAKINVVSYDAVMTTELEHSIQGVYFKNEHCGVVYTDCPHALFVEFGTGIVGEDNPHDLAQQVGWEYDTRGHGSEGWWYPADFGWWIPKKGKYQGQLMAWTQGMPARPFLYNTLRELQRIAPQVASNQLSQM